MFEHDSIKAILNRKSVEHVYGDLTKPKSSISTVFEFCISIQKIQPTSRTLVIFAYANKFERNDHKCTDFNFSFIYLFAGILYGLWYYCYRIQYSFECSLISQELPIISLAFLVVTNIPPNEFLINRVSNISVIWGYSSNRNSHF